MQSQKFERFACYLAVLILASASLVAQTKVLDIRHHCPGGGSGDNGACAIAVTKEEFDALVQAIDPNMPQSSRQSLAAEYSRVLIMAAEARRRNLDQLPEVQTLQKFAALQVLANRVVKDISAQRPHVTSEDVEKYYRSHEKEYQEVSLSRILIPKQVEGSHAALAAAESIRSRAVNGTDFTVLQREASPAASTLNIQVGPISCLSLPEPHRSVCNLQPGEVSPVITDNSGYSVYRLESRRTRALDAVQSDIRVMLERNSVQAEIQKIRTPVSLELDKSYFGELPNADVAHKHGMHFPAAKTTSDSHHHH